MVLDFVLVFLFLIITLLGYKKGFSQMLISLGVFVLSFFLVSAIYNFLGDAFFDSEYGTNLVNNVSDSIENGIGDIADIESEFPLLNIKKHDNNNILRTLAEKSLRALLAIPLIILSFFLLKILLFLIRKIASASTKLPIISGIDSLLGSLLGVVIAAVAIGVLYFTLSYIQLLPSMTFVKTQMESSYIILLINNIL